MMRITRYITETVKRAETHVAESLLVWPERLTVKPHRVGLAGFSAYVDNGSERNGLSWFNTGHGLTLEAAISEAIAIHKGWQAGTTARVEDFEK